MKTTAATAILPVTDTDAHMHLITCMFTVQVQSASIAGVQLQDPDALTAKISSTTDLAEPLEQV